MRSAPIGNWFRGVKIFFAKKRTLGNRLISCSLMTAFGQKRTSSIVMVEQRTENPRVDGSIDLHLPGLLQQTGRQALLINLQRNECAGF
jgi:hypothetical protein